MQKVLTAAQMREVDRLTTERYGIPSIILMENAAHAVARVITQKLGGSVEGKEILILCGKGNNGGDGAAIARILHADGAFVHVILYGAQREETKGDARQNFDTLVALPNNRIQFWEAPQYWDAWEYLNSETFGEIHCLVDAVFGTGSKWYDDALNEILCGWDDVPHIAVDIPTGLIADSWTSEQLQFKAGVTVTFTAPKPANVLPPASSSNGELVIANIGSPQELIDEQTSQLFLGEKDDVAEWLRKSEFSNSSYKNKRGHALMIAGSRDYSGAAVLCGDAAIRSGCGLVTIATPESSRESIVARVSPEVMVRGIAETASGSAAEKAFDEIAEFSKNVDAIAVGSGLSSKEDETKRVIKRIVEERKTPTLIDADGLTALSPWKTKGSDDLPLILTPHEGEFRKLLGVEKEEAEEILNDRVKAVRDFATTHNVFLVLKGERNLIGVPNGNVVVNPTGNSGLGKAGNGDTLTGILAGFLAQAVQMKIDIVETIVSAVYVAGMAGDIAAKKYGKRVMTASDVRECLTEVFQQFSSVDND